MPARSSYGLGRRANRLNKWASKNVSICSVLKAEKDYSSCQFPWASSKLLVQCLDVLHDRFCNSIWLPSYWRLLQSRWWARFYGKCLYMFLGFTAFVDPITQHSGNQFLDCSAHHWKKTFILDLRQRFRESRAEKNENAEDFQFLENVSCILGELPSGSQKTCAKCHTTLCHSLYQMHYVLLFSTVKELNLFHYALLTTLVHLVWVVVCLQ